MSKITKILALCLVAIMCVSCLTACGKTDDEKAREEILEGIENSKDEDAAIKQEAENIMNGVDSDWEVAEDEFLAKLENEKMGALKEAYDSYVSATNSEDIVKYAEQVNTLINECYALNANGVTSEMNIGNLIKNAISVSDRIPEWEYQAAANFVKLVENTNYSNIYFYRDRATNDYVFYTTSDNIGALELAVGTFMTANGNMCEVNLNLMQMYPTATSMYIEGFVGNGMLLCVYENGNSNYYFIDATGTTASEPVASEWLSSYSPVDTGKDVTEFISTLRTYNK